MNLEKYKKRKWRVWFRVIHRDLGFLIFSLIVMYSISGISLNHIEDWNPSYIISKDRIVLSEQHSKLSMEELVDEIAPHLDYKKHFIRDDGSVRVFVKGGTVDIVNNTAVVEVLSKRPFFYEFNFLHYNREKLWVWFSDVFAVILIIVSITGLFLVKGKYGITKYGLYWTVLGLLIPVVFLMLVI
ncbi:MAG: PepSY-associated TM helix domain-containing protein [Bacteroidota bacterium]